MWFAEKKMSLSISAATMAYPALLSKDMGRIIATSTGRNSNKSYEDAYSATTPNSSTNKDANAD